MKDEVMLTKISKIQAFKAVFKELLRHPWIKGGLGELEPNVYFGYTDHPLDVGSTALITPFTFLWKHAGKRAKCVLRVAFRERRGNAFIFSARGYDIYKILDMDSTNAHRYKVTEKTKHAALTLQLDFLRAGTYRLRLAEGPGVPENATPMLWKDIQDPGLAVNFQETTDRYVIATSELKLDVYKERFRIEIRDAQGNLVTESGSQTKNEFPTAIDAFPLGFISDRKHKKTYGVESFVLYPGEAIYGLGEQFGSVNKVGSTVGFWHIEGYGNTAGRNYKHIPFFLSTQGYGVFMNESRPITCWVGSREVCKHQIAIEGDLIDYFFFYGPSFKDILNTYTELTGKAPVPPKWSFGTWVSRISYFSQEQVLAVAKKLREMRFPSDVIHIDTGWFEKDWQCDWRFDPMRFPDPEEMFRRARAMGFRICLWQIPYVLEGTEVYTDAQEKDVLAEKHGPFVFLFVFPGSPIDFSNPQAVAWYEAKLRKLLDMGAASIKADFGEGIEPSMRFMRYDGRQMHNLYPLLYQQAAFEAVEKAKGEGEGIIWARSAYAGSQRYPVHWAGDNSANHENLLCSLRGGLSLGLSGFTFWSQDTGGFVGTPSDELYIRWTQLSIFQSHMRFHGSPPRHREPWNFAPETQAIVRDYLDLRYRLIPYLYTEAQVAAGEGLPVLRHLVIDFQDDPTVHHIEDQFMSGRSLLIAPLLTQNVSRRIYLPAGSWFDFWNGQCYKGRQWIERKADVRTIPFFVRAGTILPLAFPCQSVDELTLDGVTLKVYPDAAGRAMYEIRDKDQVHRISAHLKDEVLDVEMHPEPGAIKIELPEGYSGSAIRLNGKLMP